MAATTLSAIIAAWRTLIEASPFSLIPTVDGFTHDLQPAGMLENSYWIEDGGKIDRKSVTNDQEVRIDRLTIWIAKPLNFAGAAQASAMEDLGDDLYKQLVANGRTNGWSVDDDTRRISRPLNTEHVLASFSFRVDYDFDATAS